MTALSTRITDLGVVLPRTQPVM